MHPCDKSDNGGCDHTCKKEGDKAVCECNQDYKLNKDNKNCDKGKGLLIDPFAMFKINRKEAILSNSIAPDLSFYESLLFRHLKFLYTLLKQKLQVDIQIQNRLTSHIQIQTLMQLFN